MLNFREIAVNEPMAKACAQLVKKYSRWEEYPVDPRSELSQAQCIVGCFDEGILVGFANITQVASPDGQDNGYPWFADAVVIPAYRRQGIYKTLYDKRLEFLRGQGSPLAFSCTDSAIIETFFLNRGRKLYRTTQDESGGNCKVFQLTI